MKQNSITTVLISSFVLCSGFSAGASSTHRYTTPPDSFLQYPVYSVSQLLQEVQTDPAVRQRYAEHFQIPANEVVPWMRKNLVESWVPQTKSYTVYCVRPTGKAYYIKQTFRKGTKVFALRSGVPLMKWICGNPLMGFTQEAMANKPVIVKQSPSLEELTPGMQVKTLLPSGLAEAPLSIAGSGSSALYALAAVGGALPVLGFFSTSGSSNTPLVPHTPGAVVPESTPEGLLLAGLPLIGFAVIRRRRKLSEDAQDR